MRFQIALSVLLIFASFFVVKAQQSDSLPVADDDEFSCGLTSNLVNIKVSVWSSKAGYLKNLTDKDFVVYDEKSEQPIEFFIFDEQTNQYNIGYNAPDFLNDKWREVKVRVKLPAKKKGEYGEITVSHTNGYYPGLLNEN